MSWYGDGNNVRGLSRLRLLLILPLFIFLSLAVKPETGAAFTPWWVQSFQDTQLWSGSDADAVSFGQVPQWSYFLVSAPQQGSRLYVLNPVTGGYAYIDASAVGPSAAPPAVAGSPPPDPGGAPLRKVPTLPQGFSPSWVANFVETDLWSAADPGSPSLRHVPQFRRFMLVEAQQGNRLHVWDPETDQLGYLNAGDVGPSGPSVWLDARLPQGSQAVQLPGRAIGANTYVRNLPIVADETEIRYVPNNTPLQVRAAVTAADGQQWYDVGDGQYVRADQVRLPRPVSGVQSGRWIDADLEVPAMVTAYEGNRIVYSALAIKGTAATPTLRGTFQILRRVANETMNSDTVGIPRDGPGGYYLENVLYTQYFTTGGASLHYNYWLGTFGYPGSHGCLGLNLEDAKWFWDWASMGTTVVVR